MKTDSQHNTRAIGSAGSEIEAEESFDAKKLWRRERAGECRVLRTSAGFLELCCLLGMIGAIAQVIAWIHS